MSRINRGVTALAVSSALVAGALVGPSMASAKVKPFTCTVPNNKLTGTALSGKVSCTGAAKGSGKQTGVGTPPVLTPIFHFKGGTVKISIKNGHLVGSNVIATGAKLTGTGKFKKVKATCSAKGSLTTNKYVFSCK